MNIAPSGEFIMSKKVAIVCNGSENKSLYPTFVLASSAAASGDEVVLFFTPGAASALRKNKSKRISRYERTCRGSTIPWWKNPFM